MLLARKLKFEFWGGRRVDDEFRRPDFFPRPQGVWLFHPFQCELVQFL